MAMSRISMFVISTMFAAMTLVLAHYLQFHVPQAALRRRRRRAQLLLKAADTAQAMAAIDHNVQMEPSAGGLMHLPLKSNAIDSRQSPNVHTTNNVVVKDWVPFERLQILRRLSTTRMSHVHIVYRIYRCHCMYTQNDCRIVHQLVSGSTEI